LIYPVSNYLVFLNLYYMAVPEINNDDQLSTLFKQYIRLKSNLESVSYQIKRLGGSLPESQAPVIISEPLTDTKTIFPKNRAFLQREWGNKIIATLQSFSRPCSAKEISERIIEREPDLCVSTSHIQVKFFIKKLIQDGIIGTLPDRRPKYFLK
jgi:hypothetical protein